MQRFTMKLFCANLFCLALIAGCQQGPDMYQVSGHVHLKNGGVPKAPVRMVRFEPTKDSSAVVRRSAVGHIGEDGSYTLFSRKPGDGVYKGEYKVVFTFCKSPVDTKSMAPSKFWVPDESPYTVTVDKNLDNQDFEVEMLPGVGG
jgi:hypothetical protein